MLVEGQLEQTDPLAAFGQRTPHHGRPVTLLRRLARCEGTPGDGSFERQFLTDGPVSVELADATQPVVHDEQASRSCTEHFGGHRRENTE